MTVLLKRILRYYAFKKGMFKFAYLRFCRPSGMEYAEFLKRPGRFYSIGQNCSTNLGANITDPEYVRLGNNVSLSDCTLLGHDVRWWLPVVHIVRHPGGYINSWLNRFVSYKNPSEVTELNRRRLFDISDADPEWKQRFGDIASMGMVELELWYWRYATELIDHYGSKSPNYHLVVYEDLAHDAVSKINKIYDAARLPLTDDIQSKIEKECRSSFIIANNWKNKLPIEYQKLLDPILQDSPLNKFWHV
jgi:hypothetical protein